MRDSPPSNSRALACRHSPYQLELLLLLGSVPPETTHNTRTASNR